MSLAAGTRLGPYEILAPLGAGGMGEVYRAHDDRLDRHVAVKVLPGHLTGDERLRQRFEREARALATLSHPNVCTIHDVGRAGDVSYLVMELLEGETLAQRLGRGALPASQAVRLGVEIAAALAAAHRHGIVHRDLKPANVMLTRRGVKLLDFGLARPGSAALQTAATAELAELPTAVQPPLTTEGTILGTLSYMAPEQLTGREADARSDIFAFGAVLHEMVTGSRAFGGSDPASVIAAVLTSEPPRLSALAPGTPAALERAVKRCLAKDPDARWQSARDLELELAAMADGDPTVLAPAAGPVRIRRGERLAWAAALALLAGVLALAIVRWPRPAVTHGAVRFGVGPTDPSLTISWARISPDGRQVAFAAASAGGRSQIWLRPLDSLAARPLPGTEGGGRPFWSPDSRSVAFFAGGELKRVEIDGGMPRVVCEAPGAGPFRVGAWGPDGTIVFRVDEAPGHAEGMFRVAAAGGERSALHPIDENGQLLLAAWPSFLPDGKRFLIACAGSGQATGPIERRTGICVMSLDSGEVRQLKPVASYAEYAAPGYLLWVEGASLMAQPFDAKGARLHGEPVRIAEGLESWAGLGVPSFGASANGALVYVPTTARSRLVWKDRAGRTQGEVGTTAVYENLRLAPDGHRAAVTLEDPQSGVTGLWIVDVERNVASRFDLAGSDANSPVWSPDGRRLVYCRARDAAPSLHVKPLAGGAEEVLLASTGSMQCASDWSADGRTLLFTDRHPSTGLDVWALPLGEDGKPSPVLRTPFREHQSRFSPDGRWIAHVSDESGRPEVYLEPFGGAGEKVRVSTDGGTSPHWRRDGRELFYESAAGEVTAVAVDLGESVRVGTPERLFPLEPVGADVVERFDVSADGQRFLVIDPESGRSPGAIVVLDWAAGLPRGDAGRDE